MNTAFLRKKTISLLKLGIWEGDVENKISTLEDQVVILSDQLISTLNTEDEERLGSLLLCCDITQEQLDREYAILLHIDKLKDNYKLQKTIANSNGVSSVKTGGNFFPSETISFKGEIT